VNRPDYDTVAADVAVQTTGRRAVTSLLAGVASALLGHQATAAANKKKRKKRKKPVCPTCTTCPTCNRCPARGCCACRNKTTNVVEKCALFEDPEFGSACAAFCGAGFAALAVYNTAESSNTLVCSVDHQCVIAQCPV
jgi:hypothetical protein